ncbi:carbohydrate ABC transporter permease [Vagococcus acidifermentans]|uniref:ABC transporter n=1 Tax=Vagococcus acidifermentans TaxID=564710 RepID=A0A430B132_9ENTE|nr:carbohydrate ABC transporter permease [Vagococcus acidifermentans]RSU13961.1 ABC transporter [Vagococcus acidifermentans]
MKGNKLYKLFVYLVLIALAVSIIIPIAWVFLASIKENAEFYGNPWSLPKGVYVQNFIEAFEKANMGLYMLNSVKVTLLALVMLIIVALPASYVLARFTFPGRGLLNTLFMTGLFINSNYIVVPIFLMLLDGDKLARRLTGTGVLIDNLFVLSLVYAATALPFTIYLLSNYFRTLSKTYEEAAYMDGSGFFKTLVFVMAPLAKPSIITVILFNFLSFWNEYIIALTLLPGENKTLPVGLINLMAGQKAAANYGQLYAGLVIVMLPTLLLYILVQKQLTQGMTVGGSKE